MRPWDRVPHGYLCAPVVPVVSTPTVLTSLPLHRPAAARYESRWNYQRCRYSSRNLAVAGHWQALIAEMLANFRYFPISAASPLGLGNAAVSRIRADHNSNSCRHREFMCIPCFSNYSVKVCVPQGQSLCCPRASEYI